MNETSDEVNPVTALPKVALNLMGDNPVGSAWPLAWLTVTWGLENVTV